MKLSSTFEGWALYGGVAEKTVLKVNIENIMRPKSMQYIDSIDIIPI
jgi:hypothetical protein